MDKHGRKKRLLAMVLAASMIMTGVSPSAYSYASNTVSENADTGIEDSSTEEKRAEEISEDAISESTESDNDLLENIVIEETVSEDVAVSGNTISENTVSEDFVSGNEADTIAAREALQELTEQKDIMALIYMAKTVDVKEEPSDAGQTVDTWKSGTTVLIRDFAISENKVWYQVENIERETSSGVCGYVHRENLAYSDEDFLAWEEEWLNKLLSPMALSEMEEAVGASDYNDISLFPGSYQGALNKLKDSHPNWKFVTYEPGVDWSSAVAAQKGERSYIWYKAPDEYKDGKTGQANWYYASTKAIEYYMDPRNTLTEDYIFQNEQLTYNSTYHTQDAVQKLLSGTFMSGSIPGDSRTYAEAFYSIGKSLNMSPIHLAARVRQEQGIRGTSALISGTYSGYEGYYNYFNIKASGSTSAEVIRNGLAYAKSQGWNTRYKALKGGAEFLNSGYISVGQDTLYLQKFDLVGTLYTHQYMQNIQAPYTEGKSTKTGYANAGTLNNGFVFKIPVYNNMPVTLSLNKSSLKINKGETYTFKVYESGGQISNSDVKWTSSNPMVAAISSAGVLTAYEIGTTTITAKNSSGDVASCTVTVKNGLKSVSLNQTSYAMERGESVSLDLIYDPVDTTDDKTVIWKSSNKNVASVTGQKSGDGINDIAQITAGIPGTATITATVGTLKATCTVTVSAFLKSVSLDQTDMEVFSGDTKRLTVSYEPVYTSDDTTITWFSSDENVATVAAGIVTGQNPGTAKITASMNSANGKIFHAECQVTVRRCIVTYYDTQSREWRSETKKYGEALGTLPEITLSGNYDFSGWYSMKEGKGTKYSADSIVTNDLYVYPYFMETDRGFYVKPIGDQTYTGKAVKPQLYVYDKEKLLVQGTDYTVTYKNNKNRNDTNVINKTPLATVKGKGNYTGTQTVSFNIVKANLHDSDITAEDMVIAYTGTRKLSVPVIKQGTKKLVRNQDYVVGYPLKNEEGAYTQPGVYPIMVTGTGNYAGTITLNEVITKKTLASKLSVTKIANQIYTGAPLEPRLTVKYKGAILNEGTHYKVDYLDNTEIGTATAVITGMENAGFIGTKKLTFKITGCDIRKALVEGVKDKTYDNLLAESGIEQSGYELYYINGVGKLTENVDYTVSYINNHKAGTAAVVFTGIGKYNKELKKKYKITKAVLTESQQEVFTVPYEKGGAKPEPVVSVNGIVLKKGTDYTVKYSNNKAVNDGSDSSKLPTILITGKGNYQGTISRNFRIEAKPFAAMQVTALDGTFSQNPGKFFSKPVVKDTNGKALTAGTDYEKAIEYTYVNDVTMADESGTVKTAGVTAEKTDVPPAGTLICVTVKGRGNYTAETISCVYRIAAAQISKAKVTVDAKEYTGDAITLTQSDIKAVISKTTVLAPEDYRILPETYQKNINKGTASVIIQGLGNYGGQKKITYKILPKTFVWWWNLLT